MDKVFLIDGVSHPATDTREAWRGLETYGDADVPVRTSYRVRYAGRTRIVWLTPWARVGCYYVNVKGVRVAVDGPRYVVGGGA